jgi:flavin reductase (DIM6/NTAB) family NADH-FMN oxidoreductase RutF
MNLDPATFRAALGHFCSGVTIVSAAEGEEVRAITASAFTSVSLEPPLILVCLNREARINEIVQASGRYAVSILTSEQQDVSDRFGRRRERSAFAFERWGGLPVIEGALVHVAADVSSIVDGGDHQIILGHVRQIRIGSGEPLLYYRGGYHARRDRTA